MARALGQIDVAKSQAILDAAAEVMAERGVQAPVDEIARRAGVSKQTIYNHYGSTAEMVRVHLAGSARHGAIWSRSTWSHCVAT